MSEWISVKTKLPKESDEYLIYANDIYIAKFDKKYKRWDEKHTCQYGESQIYDSDITHWTPLPPIPEEK